MELKIRTQCKPRKKTADYEAEDISLVVDMPFIPEIGTMLKVTEHGDYMKVEDIYFDATELGFKGYQIFVESEPLWKWEDMRKEGWKLDAAEIDA